MIARLRKIGLFLLELSILTVFFFVPWWLRPDWLRDGPYYFGFLITIPVIIAIALWLALGGPGVRAAFSGPRRWWLFSFAALIAWALLSPQWSSHPDYSITAAQQFALAALFALVATSAAPRLSRVAGALAFGMVFQGVIVIGQTVLQHPIGLQTLGEFEIRPGNVGLSVVIAGSERLMRPYGLTIHPNVIAGYFMVAILVLLGGALGSRSRWPLLFGALLIGFWSLLITFSRAAYIGLLVGIVIMAILFFHAKIRAAPPRLRMLIVCAGILITIFGVTYWNFIWVRASTGDETTELRSISDRFYFMRIALQLIGEHPVAGVGIGMFPWESNDIINAGPYRGWLAGENVHNMPLLAFSELGVIGFSLWSLTLLAALWAAWRTIRSPYAIGLFAAVIAMLTIGLFDHYFWSIFHYILLLWAGLGIALSDSSQTTTTAEEGVTLTSAK